MNPYLAFLLWFLVGIAGIITGLAIRARRRRKPRLHHSEYMGDDGRPHYK